MFILAFGFPALISNTLPFPLAKVNDRLYGMENVNQKTMNWLHYTTLWIGIGYASAVSTHINPATKADCKHAYLLNAAMKILMIILWPIVMLLFIFLGEEE